MFVKETSSVTVKVGEMSEFTCQFQGEPLPVVTWLKDGHPLDHNPDYDITIKANKSKLTIFYPTADHQGSFDCVIANKHGKSVCTCTLQIASSAEGHQGFLTEEQDNQEINDEIQTYVGPTKATLQVPQAVVHKRLPSEELLSSSPVEIRVTAATPIPEMMEDTSEVTPQTLSNKTPDPATDDAASQVGKHKFTFSFDVVGRAPGLAAGLKNVSCLQGHTATLECVITGEPAPEPTWFRGNSRLELTADKYRVEVEDQVHRLFIKSFTHTDVGVYKCVARNQLGEVTTGADVSLQTKRDAAGDKGFAPSGTVTRSSEKSSMLHHPALEIVQTSEPLVGQHVKAPKSGFRPPKETPTISGCGLSSSTAVINVSLMKQAFESDSPAALITQAPPPDTRKEGHFPEEFIPDVTLSLQQEQATEAQATHANPGPPKGPQTPPQYFEASQRNPTESQPAQSGEGGGLSGNPEVKDFSDEVQESAELVKPNPLKLLQTSEQVVLEPEPAVDGRHTFDRTSSFFSFQPEKVPVAKPSIRAEGFIRPKGQTIKPEQEYPSGETLFGHITDMGSPHQFEASRTEEPVDLDSQLVVGGSEERPEQDGKERVEEHTMVSHAEPVGDEDDVSGVKLISKLEPLMDERRPKEVVSVPEPLMDSGVFVSMPESHTDVTEKSESSAVEEIEKELDGISVQPPEPIVQENLFGVSKSEIVHREEESLSVSADGEGGAVGSLEEEEVTFGAVYDYYNPPSDWGRPLSPESEMSIEIGSNVSEEIAEVAERFFTPGSSTEASQLIVESSPSAKSPLSFHTPSSDPFAGFMTPQEYPLSPGERNRASTGDSSEMFFSPVQFLTSPASERFEQADMRVNENPFLTRGRGPLGQIQDKVQGIPPAFLKPLVKKRVFENDSLRFFAEVFGLPSPKVRWFCNKTQLLADHRITVERDGDSLSLTIHNITKADQGEYICEAVNYVGEARSVALVVVVPQEARFIPALPAVTHQHVMEFDVEEDDSSRSPSPQEILLEVELDENEVKEFEKQVKIITIPEYTADNKSMIISLDVLPSIYEEGAVDFVTREHDDLKIAFEVTEMPPRFINPICDMEAPEGTVVMFECSLMGIPSPVVSWFRNDKKIPHNKKYWHSSDGDSHFLKIGRVSIQDSGVYTCRAINVVGETLCRASLVVLSAQMFSGKTRGRELTAVSLGSAKVQPQKFDLMVGNTSFDGQQVSEIELEFEFEGEADESQRAVRLVANTDKETGEQGDKYVSINFDVFAEPAKDDKVEFRGKSSETCSFQFRVTETPPKCVIPLTNVTAASGTPVILQCLANGKPNPKAEWYKDGEPVTDSRCIIQEKTAGHFNLLITNVTQSDAGEYRCVIHNSAGGAQTSALLKVF